MLRYSCVDNISLLSQKHWLVHHISLRVSWKNVWSSCSGKWALEAEFVQTTWLLGDAWASSLAVLGRNGLFLLAQYTIRWKLVQLFLWMWYCLKRVLRSWADNFPSDMKVCMIDRHIPNIQCTLNMWFKHFQTSMPDYWLWNGSRRMPSKYTWYCDGSYRTRNQY